MTTAKRKRSTKRVRPLQNGAIHDGELLFSVRGGKHDGKEIRMDAMLVKLAAENLERRHKLPVENGQLQATAEFAVDLDKALQKLGYDSSPTIAIRAWISAAEYFAQLQKKTSGSPS